MNDRLRRWWLILQREAMTGDWWPLALAIAVCFGLVWLLTDV